MRYASITIAVLLSILWITARVKTGSDVKRGFWRHVITAFGALIIFGISVGAVNDLTSIAGKLIGVSSDQVDITVAAMNKNLPVKADDVTTMQSVTYENRSIVYHMTMSEPITDRYYFESKKRSQLLENCMNSFVTNGLRSFGTMTMRYSDPQKIDAAEIILKKADCGL